MTDQPGMTRAELERLVSLYCSIAGAGDKAYARAAIVCVKNPPPSAYLEDMTAADVINFVDSVAEGICNPTKNGMRILLDGICQKKEWIDAIEREMGKLQLRPD